MKLDHKAILFIICLSTGTGQFESYGQQTETYTTFTVVLEVVRIPSGS